MSETQQTYVSEKVRDSSNVVINPSTQELQTTLNTLQSTNNDLVNALYDLVSRLEFLPWIKWTLADIRVNTTWWSLSSVTTVTTVSTVTNQAQMGWYFANTQIPSVNNTLVQVWNIRNIVIS